MLIVSQDKKAILNFDNIEFICVKPKPEQYAFGICAKFLQDEAYIGFYGTEERAKEVLQEITTAQSNFEYFKNATKEGKDYIIVLLKQKYEQFDIYKMPEK